MMDAKARQDCIKEIDLLKVNRVLFSVILVTGHLTGCGGAEPHNASTSASSASLGHFSA